MRVTYLEILTNQKHIFMFLNVKNKNFKKIDKTKEKTEIRQN